MAEFTVYSPTLNALTTGFMRIDRRLFRLLLITIVSIGLASCAGSDEQTEVQSITDAYEKALDSIATGNYRRGIQIFEAIQARYPFSDLSRQIQLELMYAYYKSGQKEQAAEAADTFMQENPIHPRVDYALYIKGLAYYESGPDFLERMFNKDVTQRPPKDIELAYASLRRLVERYPASEYAADAEQRMIAIKNRLADYENHVADYYLRRGAYVAALNRAQRSLEQFNGATGNELSLQIMAEAYEKLGMDDLAADTRRVLADNFPGNDS
jgi:outer membrane protein assembly factor BamD